MSRGELVSGPGLDMIRAVLSKRNPEFCFMKLAYRNHCLRLWTDNSPSADSHRSESTYLFSLSSSAPSKPSLQPTSIKTFIPPSNSKRDCEASELECDPSNGVKLNILIRPCLLYLFHNGDSKSA